MTPRPTSVTVVGIINIVMAVLCGCGYLTAIASPMFMGLQTKIFEVAIREEDDRIKRRIAALELQREGANEEELDAIDKELTNLRAYNPPDVQALQSQMMPRQTLITIIIASVIGLVIQALFLIAGIKLFSMTPWARSLTINAAIAAIVLVIAINLYNIFFVFPQTTAATQKFMAEMERMSSMGTGRPATQMPNMSGMMSIFSTVGAIFNIVMYCAWPIVAIILLTTKNVKAAFQAATDAHRFAPPQI